MKTYPSIPNSNGQNFRGLGVVDVFDKLDGNNLRFEFSRKRGWHKFGSRRQMIDEAHEQFGEPVRVFLDQLGDPIIKTFKKKVPDRLTVFCEWWGPNSLAGMHQPGDDMHLTLFEVTIGGWMKPKQFRKQFEDVVPTPTHLGQHNWTRGFVERVKSGEIEGITFEGVVGKTVDGPRLLMGKAKTDAWINAIRELYSPEDAERLIDS